MLVGIYKKYCLKFSLLKAGFFYFFFFFFALDKMVDSEYSMGIYKSVKISIGAVMRSPEILKFVPDHLKTKKCVNMLLKNYLF